MYHFAVLSTQLRQRAQTGYGHTLWNAKFSSKDMLTVSTSLMWHKDQHETWREIQKSQVLVPRKQFYI